LQRQSARTRRGQNKVREGQRTRTEILDAAEALFAERGPTAVSIRAIAEAVDANLSAVNYHFGSKEQLFREVVERRVVPLNAERLRLLEACDVAAGEGGRPSLECVIEAMVAPALRLYGAATSARAILIMQFLARAFAPPGAGAEFEPLYEPVRSRFVGLVRRSLPELSETDILWRYNFLVAAILYSIVMPSGPAAEGAPGKRRRGFVSEEMIARVVAYAAGGFRAKSFPTPVRP